MYGMFLAVIVERMRGCARMWPSFQTHAVLCFVTADLSMNTIAVLNDDVPSAEKQSLLAKLIQICYQSIFSEIENSHFRSLRPQKRQTFFASALRARGKDLT